MNSPARRHQRGAALLLAMIIVTLIATLAVSMVWQQWRAVQVEGAGRARAQSTWILSGALDWAGLILREDGRPKRNGEIIDHLGEPWAVPLAEARLSSFLSVDKQVNDEGPEAFLSGSISDAQGRFNLRNLVDATGKPSPVHSDVLLRLCENINVSASVAMTLTSGLQRAWTQATPESSGGTSTATDVPLVPKRISQLTWLGIDEAAVQRLAPYVVILPETGTLINVNTASRELIAAAIPGINVGDAERLIQIRQRTPFKQVSDITTQLPSAIDTGRMSVFSNYFEVRGKLRLEDRSLEQRSLVRRNNAQPIVVLSSERIQTTEGQLAPP